MRVGLPWLCLVLVGCTRTTQPSAAGPSGKGAPGAGSSLDAPVMRCGPRDSYAYVAREFKCPDGSNPFAGDLDAAHDARSGSVKQPKSGDLVDTYEVPCPGKPQTVYVNMYGCAEMKEEARRAGESPALKEILRAFERGDEEGTAQRCLAAMQRQNSMPEVFWCTVIASAQMVGSGVDPKRTPGAEYCQALPPVSPRSNTRVEFVALVMQATVTATKTKPLSDQDLSRILRAFSAACSIQPEQVIEELKRDTGPRALASPSDVTHALLSTVP